MRIRADLRRSARTPAMILALLAGPLALAQDGPAAPPPTQPQATPPPAVEPPAPSLTLRRIGSVAQPSAEIAGYDPLGRRAYIAGGAFVAEIDLRRPGYPGWVRQFDLSEAAGFPSVEVDREHAAEVTHVAVDPSGRNFAVASVCPRDFAAREGAVVFFHMPTGVMLKSLKVGFNPDSLAFTPDGSTLIVANEGRPALRPDGGVVDPPGGLSIIELSGLPDVETLVRQLGADRVMTIDLDGPVVEQALAAGAAGPRIHPAAKDNPALDLEPESLAINGDRVYVTLQENNAIAVFDLPSRKWVRIAGLGSIEQTIDASDFDGGIKIAQKVRGLPMPDQIAAFTAAGRTYLVTADEGDDRGDSNDRSAPRGDRARVRDLARWNKMSPKLMSTADLSDPVIGRLQVSVFDGDTDGDGLIDVPTMFGTRSLSVWDAETLQRVGDTGSAFEQMMADRDKEHFNAERVGSEEPPVFQFDARSPERGPEPEGIAIGQVAGRTFAFVSLERPGAIVAVDLTDPANPRPIELAAAAASGDVGPEGILFVPAEQSAASEAMLLVCSENTGTLSVYRIITR
ncbi:MAG: choice-of-anchor I family protein [Phycisphaerales bacterium]|nr:choice-of-anchor I family protein [Phycisphaerales bacterium]